MLPVSYKACIALLAPIYLIVVAQSSLHPFSSKIV
jgi:hypothetical protein